MILSLATLLALGAFLASLFRLGSSAKPLLGAALFLLFSFGYPLFPRLLLDGLQKEEPVAWKSHNVIVVLGAGTSMRGTQWSLPLNGQSRALKAADLFQACRRASNSCAVLASGGDPQHHGISEAAALSFTLQQLGVPASAIWTEEKSSNTFQNARNSAALLRDKKIDLVALATSGTHMARAQLFFSHFGIKAVAQPSDLASPATAWLPSSANLALSELALREYLGLLQFHIYNFAGWNEPAQNLAKP